MHRGKGLRPGLGSFRDVTRQTQIPPPRAHTRTAHPSSSPVITHGRVTATNYLLTHPIISPTAQAHLGGVSHLQKAPGCFSWGSHTTCPGRRARLG